MVDGKSIVAEIPGNYPEIVKVTDKIRANETDTGCFAIDISGNAWYIANSPDNQEISWQIRPISDAKDISHIGWKVKCLTNSGEVISTTLERYEPTKIRICNSLTDPISLSGKHVLCADGSVHEIHKRKSTEISLSEISQLVWPLALTSDGSLLHNSEAILRSVSKIGSEIALMESGKLYIVMPFGILYSPANIPDPDRVVFMTASGTRENNCVGILYDNGDLLIINLSNGGQLTISDVTYIEGQTTQPKIAMKSARSAY